MSDDNWTGPRVVDLPSSDKAAARWEEVRRGLTVVLANADVVAKIRRANYEALLREGFTEAQALDLCWR